MERVLVTGVSGYVGQHCAAELLKAGYAVRGTIRSEKKKEEVLKGLGDLVKAEGDIDFAEANLLSDDGWAEAMSGCAYVLHVASPFFMKEPKTEEEYIQPAVEGTLRVLKAAKQAGIPRVVLTSSTVSMMGDQKTGTLTPASWTDEKSSKISVYTKSKAMAEKAAWQFIQDQKEDQKLELVVINPGGIFGPTLTGNITGQSMTMVSQMITGHYKMAALPDIQMPLSDVRDVAKLHVMSLTTEKANGKRIMATADKPLSFIEVAQLLKDNGYEKVSTRKAPSWIISFMALFDKEVKGMLPFVGTNLVADNSETKSLFDWQPIDFKKTVLDTVQSIEK